MTPALHTLEQPASLLHVTPVLNRNGFNCSLVTLEPGAASALPTSASGEDQLLFVVDGDIAIETGGLTTLVGRGAATLLAPADAAVVTARSDLPARVLRVEIPPRRVITPQIITPRS